MSASKLEAGLKRVGIDRYMILLAATVVLASLAPARGQFSTLLQSVTFWAVALLFFLYGAKLSTATIVTGLRNWKLQTSCLLCTFVLFPLLTMASAASLAALFPAAVVVGILYLGCMPSTVQSSIAFTSISNGNVAGAICAASISSLLGVVLSPLLLAALVPSAADFGISPSAIWKIVQQILLPFVVGQFCRPLLADFLNRHKTPTMIVDRGSILLIVYSAFSGGVVNGIWSIMPWQSVAGLAVLCLLLLALVMGATLLAGRLSRMNKPDMLALFYCGSTKSLATGLPMAGILFAGKDFSLIVLPLMLFHLIQLVTCAVVSQRVRA